MLEEDNNHLFLPIQKGFVEKPEDWKYSSARNWILEDDSIIKIYRELIWG